MLTESTGLGKVFNNGRGKNENNSNNMHVFIVDRMWTEKYSIFR